MKLLRFLGILLAAGCVSTPHGAVRGGYAPVHGLRMYYEIHGNPDAAGTPLVLLHGGGSTIETSFGRILPHFPGNRRIIAVEQQGHGRTADVDRPFSFTQSADDTAELLRYLQVDRADVLGYSNGGHIAVEIALRHPALVRRLIVESAMVSRDGCDPPFWEMFKTANLEEMPAELQEAYRRTSPHPEKLRSHFDKSVKRMLDFKGWTPEQLRTIQAPTLILAGDHDIVRPEHLVMMFRTIPNSQLAVLPGTDHRTIVARADLVVPAVEAFLKCGVSAPPFPFDGSAAATYQKESAEEAGLPVAFTARSGLRFVFVPPGAFLMGSPEDEPGRKPDERRHPVTLTQPIYLGRCEVTVGEFRRFVRATGHVTEVEKSGGGNAHDAKAVWTHAPGTSWRKPGYAGPFTPTDDHPVVHVSHLDARAYCAWLNASAPEPGWTYGLPTEAEWEWACRAGCGGPSNGAGINAGDHALKAVHPEWPRRTAAEDDGHPFAAPVGTFRPNAFGLHDMLGNVWEFCSTKHGAYPAGPETDPGDRGDRESYDVRGGGWSNEPADVRCAARNADPPKFGHSNLGFRVALHRP